MCLPALNKGSTIIFYSLIFKIVGWLWFLAKKYVLVEADVGAEGNGSDEGDSNLPSTSSNVEVTIKVPGKRKRSGKW